ncbi:MAG: DEAD/DEAH box helicase [Polyangiaceae bacterium]
MPSTEPTTFSDFELDPRIVTTVTGLGYETPTPIQEQAIPHLLSGRDIIGRARTGSGKTAAFGLPLLERVKEGPQQVAALVLTPTRELAVQVATALAGYSKQLPVRLVTLYGGVAYGPQLAALRRGVSVVVGTPGRVLDHMARGRLDISALQLLVLDEADEMLRMGFIDDVEQVLASCPPERQIALFSATLPPPIKKIATSYLHDPIEVQVEERAHTTSHIEQRWLLVPQAHKLDALARVLADQPHGATLIFARTRAGAADAAAALAAQGLEVDALHGDLSQNAREQVLARLKGGRLFAVVATDVAARGLDVEQLTHVVNLDLPTDLDTYVHRIGRTGRAGRAGLATSLVTPMERGRLNRFARVLDTPLSQAPVPTDYEIARRRSAGLMAEVERALSLPASETVDTLSKELLERGTPQAVVSALLTALAQARGVDLDSPASREPPAWARASAKKYDDRGWKADRGRGRSKEAAGSKAKRDGERGAKEQRGAPRGAKEQRGAQRDARDRKPERSNAKKPYGMGAATSPKSGRRGGEPEVELFLPAGESSGVRPQDVVGALAGDLGIPTEAIGRIEIERGHTLVSVPKELGKMLLDGEAGVRLRGRWVSIGKARPRRPKAR